MVCSGSAELSRVSSFFLKSLLIWSYYLKCNWWIKWWLRHYRPPSSGPQLIRPGDLLESGYFSWSFHKATWPNGENGGNGLNCTSYLIHKLHLHALSSSAHNNGDRTHIKGTKYPWLVPTNLDFSHTEKGNNKYQRKSEPQNLIGYWELMWLINLLQFILSTHPLRTQ